MKPVHAEIVHDALKESGINFVAYLPDDQIHDAQKLLTEDPSFSTKPDICLAINRFGGLLPT